MNFPYSDEAKSFRAILDNPALLSTLPTCLKYDTEFLDIFYIVLGDEIAPYIPYQIFEKLKYGDRQKASSDLQVENAPKTMLGDEEDVIHQLFSDPSSLSLLSTDDKYDDSLLEIMYLLWGDEISPYIPDEMYQQLVVEEAMRTYHLQYERECRDWAKNFPGSKKKK